jgi:hypothetical protein
VPTPRRRARAEAVRQVGVRVRLSPEEAALVRVAAARASLSVGAWIGEAAVSRARSEDRGVDRGEAEGQLPTSWRELVAALMTLRTEVVEAGISGARVAGGAAGGSERAADRGIAVVSFSPAGVELVDPLSDTGSPDTGGNDARGLLRCIDAATEAAIVAAASARPRSSRGGRRRPSGPS